MTDKRFADDRRDPDPECALLPREFYERIGKHVVFWGGSMDGDRMRAACADSWMEGDAEFAAFLDEVASFDYLTIVVPKGSRVWSPTLRAAVFSEIAGRPLVDKDGVDRQTPKAW